MSSVLDFFLEGPWDDTVLSPGLAPPNLPMRSAMLMTPSDIKELVSTVHKVNALWMVKMTERMIEREEVDDDVKGNDIKY